MLLALKIAVPAAFFTLVSWVVQYTLLARWWRNDIGRTLVVKTAVIAALLVPTTIMLFVPVTPVVARIAGWLDVALIAMITPVMWWRILVFDRVYRAGAGDLTFRARLSFLGRALMGLMGRMLHRSPRDGGVAGGD